MRSLNHSVLLFVFLFCPFFTTVYAQYACLNLFTQSQYTSVELLKELIHNRTLPIVSGEKDSAQNRSWWFLSHSNEGETYLVTVWKKVTGEVVTMRAEVLTPAAEKKYFVKAAQFLTPVETMVDLPRKGRRKLVISPEVQVKLWEKHSLRPQHLVEAFKSISPNVKYRENKHIHFQGRDSFIFFLDTGKAVPLEVVLLHENNVYILVTAFYPDVYRPI